MDELRARHQGDVVLVPVRVQPKASRDAIVGVHDGALKITVTAPPSEGEANAAVIALLAKKLGVAKRDVTIAHGDSSRQKLVAIRGVGLEAVYALVEGQR